MVNNLEFDFMLPSKKPITGTLIWYYIICKREVWLMSRAIIPEQEHQALDLGRVTHEFYYKDAKKEVEIEGAKIDFVRGRKGTICEVKTSSKFLEAAKLQLAYYLYRLEKMGVKARGEVLIPRENKRIRVILDERMLSKLRIAMKEIVEICSGHLPPPAVKTHFCKNCAYSDFCWGDEF